MGCFDTKEEVVPGGANATSSTMTTTDLTEEVPMETQQTQETLDITVSIDAVKLSTRG